jgi:hypothetical protein
LVNWQFCFYVGIFSSNQAQSWQGETLYIQNFPLLKKYDRLSTMRSKAHNHDVKENTALFLARFVALEKHI